MIDGNSGSKRTAPVFEHRRAGHDWQRVPGWEFVALALRGHILPDDELRFVDEDGQPWDAFKAKSLPGQFLFQMLDGYFEEIRAYFAVPACNRVSVVDLLRSGRCLRMWSSPETPWFGDYVDFGRAFLYQLAGATPRAAMLYETISEKYADASDPVLYQYATYNLACVEIQRGQPEGLCRLAIIAPDMHTGPSFYTLAELFLFFHSRRCDSNQLNKTLLQLCDKKLLPEVFSSSPAGSPATWRDYRRVAEALHHLARECGGLGDDTQPGGFQPWSARFRGQDRRTAVPVSWWGMLTALGVDDFPESLLWADLPNAGRAAEFIRQLKSARLLAQKKLFAPAKNALKAVLAGVKDDPGLSTIRAESQALLDRIELRERRHQEKERRRQARDLRRQLREMVQHGGSAAGGPGPTAPVAASAQGESPPTAAGGGAGTEPPEARLDMGYRAARLSATARASDLLTEGEWKPLVDAANKLVKQYAEKTDAEQGAAILAQVQDALTARDFGRLNGLVRKLEPFPKLEHLRKELSELCKQGRAEHAFQRALQAIDSNPAEAEVQLTIAADDERYAKFLPPLLLASHLLCTPADAAGRELPDLEHHRQQLLEHIAAFAQPCHQNEAARGLLWRFVTDFAQQLLACSQGRDLELDTLIQTLCSRAEQYREIRGTVEWTLQLLRNLQKVNLQQAMLDSPVARGIRRLEIQRAVLQGETRRAEAENRSAVDARALAESAVHFVEAIEEEPECAEAWVKLAECRIQQWPVRRRYKIDALQVLRKRINDAHTAGKLQEHSKDPDRWVQAQVEELLKDAPVIRTALDASAAAEFPADSTDDEESPLDDLGEGTCDPASEHHATATEPRVRPVAVSRRRGWWRRLIDRLRRVLARWFGGKPPNRGAGGNRGDGASREGGQP